MKTTLLYHDDPWLLSFDAPVAAHGTLTDAAGAARPSVVLARTAFYPEAGGQMADRGVLGGLPIVDVQVDADDVVHHIVAGPLPPIGSTVAGIVDRPRRRLFMALHTAQHMLSKALVDVAKADTVSARLGETACTIDVDVPALSDASLGRACDLVNAVVDDDVRIRAWFPDEAELRALPLRRQPKVAEHVRVVAVEGFDVSPCGGTHCTQSAQVGVVRITGVEKYKGKTRVTFEAGPRARSALMDEARALRAMAAQLSCGPLDVAAALDRVRRDLASSRDTTKKLSERVAAALADELAARAQDGRIVAVLDDKELVRQVAARLCTVPGTVALLAANDAEGTHFLCARGPGAVFDCGAFVKTVAAAHGGKGGGKPERAEGRAPMALDWAALCAAVGAP